MMIIIIIIIKRCTAGFKTMQLQLNTHVTPPSPIEVKKLIEKRVLRGLSRGKIPSKYSARNLSRQERHLIVQ